MIKRIVKLTFREEEVEKFLENFEQNKLKISGFEGCRHLELWRDKKAPNIFFTYSYWESEAALNAYRHSDLFKGIWSKTKVLFSDKPEAWSIDVVWEKDKEDSEA